MFHNVVRRSLKASSQYTLGRASRNLPASRCDRKCIQNDLDVRCVRWNRTDFYSSVRARCNAHPNQFVCTSGRNARPCIYCEPALKRSTLGGRSCNHFMFSSGIRGLWSLSTSNYLPRIRLANFSHAQVEASASFAICTYLSLCCLVMWRHTLQVSTLLPTSGVRQLPAYRMRRQQKSLCQPLDHRV